MILCFHSIRDVPPGIMVFVNYVVLFKTTEDYKYVEKKFPMLYESYMRINYNHYKDFPEKAIPNHFIQIQLIKQ